MKMDLNIACLYDHNIKKCDNKILSSVIKWNKRI